MDSEVLSTEAETVKVVFDESVHDGDLWGALSSMLIVVCQDAAAVRFISRLGSNPKTVRKVLDHCNTCKLHVSYRLIP